MQLQELRFVVKETNGGWRELEASEESMGWAWAVWAVVVQAKQRLSRDWAHYDKFPSNEYLQPIMAGQILYYEWRWYFEVDHVGFANRKRRTISSGVYIKFRGCIITPTRLTDWRFVGKSITEILNLTNVCPCVARRTLSRDRLIVLES
jgi:hypothetical protein